MAIFLVDSLMENKMGGLTHTMSKIIHNLQIIGVEYYQSFLKELEASKDGLVQICACGRYMTIINIPKDKKSGGMIFMDVKNDRNIALDTCNLIKADTIENKAKYTQWFMEEFEKMSPYYHDNYNAAELFLGESPLN